VTPFQKVDHMVERVSFDFYTEMEENKRRREIEN